MLILRAVPRGVPKPSALVYGGLPSTNTNQYLTVTRLIVGQKDVGPLAEAHPLQLLLILELRTCLDSG